MDQERLKGVYRLWWEYLEQSDNYRELCDFVASNIPPQDFRVPDRCKIIPLIDSLPAKFQPDPPSSILSPIVKTYINFDDIHKYDFEVFWQRLRPSGNVLERGRIKLDDSISYQKYLRQCMDFVLDSLRKRHSWHDHDPEPTLEQFRDAFLLYFRCDNNLVTNYLRLNISAADDYEEIIDTVKKEVILERERQISLDPDLNFATMGYVRIPKDFREDPIKRYLDVFKCWKAKMDCLPFKRTPRYIWDEVIFEVNKGKKVLNISWQCSRDCRIAKKIIKNAEQGLFPGPHPHS